MNPATLRGMISMAVTNRMGARLSATGLTVFLVLAIGVSFSLVGGAARALADDDKSSSETFKALQGTWISENEGIDSKWTFEGEKVKANVQGVDYTCKVKLDPKAKPHPTLDFVIEDGPDEFKGKTSKSIYKLDGEKLKLCLSLPGKDRPKEFEQTEDESYIFELKKEKKS
jgi:uncharacterized protein (TIGR03067 family)